MSEDGSSWVPSSRFQQLVSALSVSVLGYNFLDNPEGFVLAVLYRAIVDTLTGLAGEVGLILGDVWGIFIAATIDTLGTAVAAPVLALASTIEGLLDMIDSVATGLAASAGPLGLLAAVVVWGVAAIAAIALISAIWNGYKWVRTVVV